MVEWWSVNWAAIKDLMFYGFWLGCGALGAILMFGLLMSTIQRIRDACERGKIE